MQPGRNTEIADVILRSILGSSAGSRRLKVRTLLQKFGYVKRSDTNTAAITTLLADRGISINPPLVRLGADWDLSTEDWIYLSIGRDREVPDTSRVTPALTIDWNRDGWFDRIADLELRTEKEVEIKFIVPLLFRLGYSEDDRYDGMPVPAAHGSRATTLVIDFTLFNSSLESLRNQPLLTVEAKRESRLAKAAEIRNAHNQAKSYCLWTQCDYFLVTDSRVIQLYHVRQGGLNGPSPLFECRRAELRERFSTLYSIASKEVLTRLYLAKLSNAEELQ